MKKVGLNIGVGFKIPFENGSWAVSLKITKCYGVTKTGKRAMLG
jgi:hypothetical protein